MTFTKEEIEVIKNALSFSIQSGKEEMESYKHIKESFLKRIKEEEKLLEKINSK